MMKRGGTAIGVFLSFLLSVVPVFADDVRLIYPPKALAGRVLPFETPVPVVFSIANKGTVAEDLLVTTYFERLPEQQFGRRFWLPANSSRIGWYLLTIPPGTESGDEVEAPGAQTLVLRRTSGGEAAILTIDGKRSADHFFRCSATSSPVLLLTDIESEEPAFLLEAASAVAPSAGAFHSFWDEPFPPVVEAYDGYTHIVLATKRLADDLAGQAALRQWVFNGGRLWVLLDIAGADLLASLLDDEGVSAVDSVDVTDIQMEAAPGISLNRPEERRSFEDPVAMTRVAASGFQEIVRLDGWPAALRKPYGDGAILVTTVGPRAWYRPPGPYDRNQSQYAKLKFVPTESCLTVAHRFFTAEPADDRANPDWQSLANNYVGYRVTSRATVATVLIGYCLLILLGGFFFLRSERLGNVLWFAPASAAVAALTLAGIGYAARTSIPPTEAMLQFVDLDQTGEASIRGALSIYQTTAGQSAVGIRDQGRVRWSTHLPGAAKRLIYRDDGSRRWENLDLLAGVHELEIQVPRWFPPSDAIVTVNEHGLTGTLNGQQWTDPSGGVLAFATGRFAAVRFHAPGDLQSTPGDLLPPGQFLLQEILGDRERNQAAAYQQILVGTRRLPPEPRLYFWTSPIDLDVDVPEGARRAGDALISLPVRLVPPPSGGRVVIPPSLIEYNAVSNANGGVSTIYSNRTRLWTDAVSNESFTTLECFVPPELGPLNVTQVKAAIELHAANRTVRVVAVDTEGREHELKSWSSPSGRYEWTIDSPTHWNRSQPSQFLRLIVHVGPLPGEGDFDPNKASWRIDDLTLEAAAVVGP